MAKPTLRSTTVPKKPREEGFLTMRKTLTNEVQAVFTIHDTHIGLVDDNADLTVNGGLKVSGGATGVLHLPDGTQTIRAGENVVVNYSVDGSVEISTQTGEDISYILTAVEGFDSRITQAENDIGTLQSQQVTNAGTLQGLQAGLTSLTSTVNFNSQTMNAVAESFAGFEDRLMATESRVSEVTISETAQNSRITALEDGLYEERLARISGDSTLSSSIVTERSERISGDQQVLATFVTISSSFSSMFESTSASIVNLSSSIGMVENRVTSLEFASSTFSSDISTINLSSQSLSSSVASDVNYLKALFMSGVIADISGNMVLETLSGTFSDRLTSAESLFQTVPNTISVLSSSLTERITFLEISSSQMVNLTSRVTTLEQASGTFASDIFTLFGSLSTISSSLNALQGVLENSVTSLSSSVATDINELRVNGGGGGGGPATIGQFAFNETPLGVIDGENVTFELDSVPSPPGSLMLFHNGQLLKVGNDHDYTLSGRVITFVGEIVPQPDDVIMATYQYSVPVKSYSFNESVTLTVSGEVLLGFLEHEPDPPNSLMLFYNGQLLSAGATKDYTISGKNIEIGSTTYQQDDVCLATYSHY